MYSLSGRQQVLLLVFLDARASRLHLQRGGGGLLCGWLDEMSKQLCLLQQVLKSVGPVCLLHTQEDTLVNIFVQEQSSEPCNGSYTKSVLTTFSSYPGVESLVLDDEEEEDASCPSGPASEDDSFPASEESDFSWAETSKQK